MGLPRLGGQGGNGGDVWVVAKKNMTLKTIKDKYPQKRFVGGAGANSGFVLTNDTFRIRVHQLLISVDDICLSEIFRHVV